MRLSWKCFLSSISIALFSGMCVFIKDSQNVWHKYLGTGFLYGVIDFFQAHVPVPYKCY